jgi:hypothetical protein
VTERRFPDLRPKPVEKSFSGLYAPGGFVVKPNASLTPDQVAENDFSGYAPAVHGKE